jgi:FkbM family methyltransferase
MAAYSIFLGLIGVASAANLRTNVTAVTKTKVSRVSYMQDNAPCKCIANDPSWKKTSRTEGRCIFIDLGAADGNTFEEFLTDGYGPVRDCPNGGKWEAFLVEANPQFSPKLKALEKNLAGEVHSFAETAAFDCKGETSFFIDEDATHNHWGSSMFHSAPDVKNGKRKVTVPTMNVAQLIAENVIPEDWVMLKVDIESAEYSVIPCLAEFKQVNLVDRLYLEEHHWFASVTEDMKEAMVQSKKKLQALGVDIPKDYYTST